MSASRASSDNNTTSPVHKQNKKRRITDNESDSDSDGEPCFRANTSATSSSSSLPSSNGPRKKMKRLRKPPSMIEDDVEVDGEENGQDQAEENDILRQIEEDELQQHQDFVVDDDDDDDDQDGEQEEDSGTFHRRFDFERDMMRNKIDMQDETLDDENDIDDHDWGDGDRGEEEDQDLSSEPLMVGGRVSSPVIELMDDQEVANNVRLERMTKQQRQEYDVQQANNLSFEVPVYNPLVAMTTFTGPHGKDTDIAQLFSVFKDELTEELGIHIKHAYQILFDKDIASNPDHEYHGMVDLEAVTKLLVRMKFKCHIDPSASGKGMEGEVIDNDYLGQIPENMFGGETRDGEVNVALRIKKHYAQCCVEVEMLYGMIEYLKERYYKDAPGEYIRSLQIDCHRLMAQLEHLHNIAQSKIRLANVNQMGSFMSDERVPTLVQAIDMEDQELNASQRLNIYINEQCRKLGLRKMGSDLWEQNLTPEGFPKNSYKKKCSVKTFIYHASKMDENPAQWKNRTHDHGTVNKIEKDIVEGSENTIPELKRTRHCWAFENCFYDGSDDTIYRYGIDQLPNKIAARDIAAPLTDLDPVGKDYIVRWKKDRQGRFILDENGRKIKEYFDEDSNPIEPPELRSWMDIKTPLVDQIMKDQKWSRSVQKWFWVFMGRMAFPLGIHNGGDNWQRVVLLFGKGGTGKSTLAKHFCQMATPDDILDIESKGETTFSLEKAYEPHKKWIWRILEVKGDNNSLGSERFQKMVEGCPMVIPRKNKQPLEVEWDLVGIMCGNDRLPFDDSQDSISRRTETWEFKYKVKQNTYLSTELQRELPNDIRKAVTGYRYVRDWVGMNDPGPYMGPYFQKTKQNLKTAVDVVTQFLTEACDVSQKDSIVPWDVFRVELMQWMHKMRKTGKSVSDEQIHSALEAHNAAVLKVKPAVQDDNNNNNSDQQQQQQQHTNAVSACEKSLIQDSFMDDEEDEDDGGMGMPNFQAISSQQESTKQAMVTCIYREDPTNQQQIDVTAHSQGRYIKGVKILDLRATFGVK